MENASKALIIAGAILLSILIIALGIYVFNMAKNATNTDSLNELDIQQFNSKFTDYEGRVLGSSVANLLENVMTNATQNKDAEERLMDVVYVDSRTNHPTVDAGTETDAEKNVITAFLGEHEITDDGNVQKIYSNTTELNTAAIGKLRSSLANRHFYQVDFHKDPNSGLVDCILINYTAN